MKRKVSDLVAEFLDHKDMPHVFGIIGSAIGHVFDSIGNRGTPRMVCTHHEQAACMAAQGYYRIAGRPTAAIVTAGGGSSNAITGVLSAWMDSLPMLVISGNENSKFTHADNPLRIWGIQGFDSVEMVRRITKYAARVLEPNCILYELEKAYYIATHGRPGPVWIDIPINIQGAIVEEEELLRFAPEHESVTAMLPSVDAVEVMTAARRTADLLRTAKRPVFWLGNGIRSAGAVDRLQSFLDHFQIPALVTWAMIDAVDSDHPLIIGRAGLYGQRAANFALQNADVVVAIGTRMPLQQVGYEISELAREARIVVVDIDRHELAKYASRYSVSLCADAGQFMDALVKATPTMGSPPDWVERCNAWRRDYPSVGPEHADRDGFINAYRFLSRLNAFFHPDQVVVTDAGTALLAGHQVLRMKPPQRLFTSLGLGEMGYGLPAAIGAAVARNGGEVMCLNCDGGMMMNLQELQTMVHHQLPVKIVIFNNDGYLMIKHTQNAMFAGRHYAVARDSGVSCPDFSALARAMGIQAFSVATWDDVEHVLPALQAHKGPAICEVRMHPEQPMVPKLSLALQADGTLVSPPLEDLSPLLPREELRRNMLCGLHPKSVNLKP